LRPEDPRGPPEVGGPETSCTRLSVPGTPKSDIKDTPRMCLYSRFGVAKTPLFRGVTEKNDLFLAGVISGSRTPQNRRFGGPRTPQNPPFDPLSSPRGPLVGTPFEGVFESDSFNVRGYLLEAAPEVPRGPLGAESPPGGPIGAVRVIWGGPGGPWRPF